MADEPIKEQTPAPVAEPVREDNKFVTMLREHARTCKSNTSRDIFNDLATLIEKL
jgi:hypothetical protein